MQNVGMEKRETCIVRLCGGTLTRGQHVEMATHVISFLKMDGSRESFSDPLFT